MIEKKKLKQIFIICAFFVIIIIIIILFRKNTEQFVNKYTNTKIMSLQAQQKLQNLQKKQLINLEIEKTKLQSMLSELNLVSIDKLNIQNSFRIGDNILLSPTEMHITTSNRGEINMVDKNSSITIGDQTLDYDKIKYINELYNSRKL
jgi:hypothetical protein